MPGEILSIDKWAGIPGGYIWGWVFILFTIIDCSKECGCKGWTIDAGSWTCFDAVAVAVGNGNWGAYWYSWLIVAGIFCYTCVFAWFTRWTGGGGNFGYFFIFC